MRRLQHSHALLFMLFCLMTAATLRLSDLPQVPAGVHYDEAANGILAAEIGLEGERPLFITSYTGKEVLFFYLAGGLMRLLGSSIFTLRLTAAFVGIVTVAAVYWLGLELFRDRRVALVASALLAISFWHLLFSHLGFRAITQPLLQTLTVAALLRGVRLDRRKWLLLSGVFLGLTAYTYLAARLFPVLLLLASLPLLVGGYWRKRTLQLLLVGGVALIVLAPLLGFFVANPDAFWVRITQVAPDETALSLGESILRSLQMFFLVGDPYIRFNLPERPLFGWFWGGLLLVGWMMLVWRWRALQADWQRSSVLLLLLAPFIMLLPTALAVNEIVPSNLRAMGLIPFIFYLPGVGLMVFVNDLGKQFKRVELTSAVLTVGVLALMVGGLLTERLYFRVWAQDTAVFYETDGDLTAVADFLDQLDTEGKNIYVSALHYQHPTLAYLSEKYEQVKWLPESQAVVFPAREEAIYIFPHNSPLPRWAIDYFGQADLLPGTFAPDGSVAFLAYEMSGTPAALMPTQPLSVNFGNAITLLGYDVAEATAGETLPVFLYWRVNFDQTAAFTPFIHFEDGWGHRWSQEETFAYPSTQWSRGETIVQRVEIELPTGTPLGNNYQLRIGLFSGSSGERLPRLDEDGRYAGDTYLIENIVVQPGDLPRHLPQPPIVLNQTIRPQLELLGLTRGALEAATGESVELALWWHATEPVPQTTIRLELMGSNNVGRILNYAQPVHSTYPFTNWQTPQFLIDWQTVRVPDNIPAGEYRLLARFLDGADATLATSDLGPLRVTVTERSFTVPEVIRPYPATFGNEIKLLGYNLTPLNEPDQYQLDLIWQAQTEPGSDYTVFVHLLQGDGSCNPCLWQQDVMPQQNQYPTSRWLTDEVVTDSYQITLPPDTPPGSYQLEIGLYIAETGQRLQVVQPNGSESDAVLLESIIVEN